MKIWKRMHQDIINNTKKIKWEDNTVHRKIHHMFVTLKEQVFIFDLEPEDVSCHDSNRLAAIPDTAV